MDSTFTHWGTHWALWILTDLVMRQNVTIAETVRNFTLWLVALDYMLPKSFHPSAPSQRRAVSVGVFTLACMFHPKEHRSLFDDVLLLLGWC